MNMGAYVKLIKLNPLAYVQVPEHDTDDRVRANMEPLFVLLAA